MHQCHRETLLYIYIICSDSLRNQPRVICLHYSGAVTQYTSKCGLVLLVKPNWNAIRIISVQRWPYPYIGIKGIHAAADTSTVVFPISYSQESNTALRGVLCFCNQPRVRSNTVAHVQVKGFLLLYVPSTVWWMAAGLNPAAPQCQIAAICWCVWEITFSISPCRDARLFGLAATY